MPEPPLSPRMELLLTAALHVVAEHGLRGLTHRAVDREAGLPEGSCSAYLRTRKALVLALTQYVANSLADDVEVLAADLTACQLGEDEAVEAVTGLLHALAGRARPAAGADGAVARGRPRPGAGRAAGRLPAPADRAGRVDPVGAREGPGRGRWPRPWWRRSTACCSAPRAGRRPSGGRSSASRWGS